MRNIEFKISLKFSIKNDLMRGHLFSKSFLIIIIMGTSIILADLYGIQKSEWKGKIEYENGVGVIKNPNEPQYGAISIELEEDLVIEDKNGKDYFFQWLSDVNVDSKGNIYILDRQQHRAYIFDKMGNYIKSIGGRGQGPGEFNTPTRIVIDGEDRVNVLVKRKLHLFDQNANFIKSINFNFPVFVCCLTKHGNILIQSNEMGPKGASQKIYALNSEGSKIKTIDEISNSMEDLQNPNSAAGQGLILRTNAKRINGDKDQRSTVLNIYVKGKVFYYEYKLGNYLNKPDNCVKVMLFWMYK